jgi:hypothetical protein
MTGTTSAPNFLRQTPQPPPSLGQPANDWHGMDPLLLMFLGSGLDIPGAQGVTHNPGDTGQGVPIPNPSPPGPPMVSPQRGNTVGSADPVMQMLHQMMGTA